MSETLEPADTRILRALQDDGRLTNQALAERVGLSASPCWRRVRALEETGVIRGYRAVIERRKVGLGVLAFARVRVGGHSDKEAQEFADSVARLEAVVACYAIAGDADFLLEVVASDLDAYARFSMEVLRALPHIKEMQTMFVLKEIKPYQGLPVAAGG